LAFIQLLGAAEPVDHHGPHHAGATGIRVPHAIYETADGRLRADRVPSPG
jgi:hypothetical protein